jgi:phosphatidylglycerol---prolipoprotein diacylglyceryl transferase
VVIGLDPVILSFGGLAVRWFGVLAVLGLCVGTWLTLRHTRCVGLNDSVVLGALAWAIPIGTLTARLAHVLGIWDFYLTHPSDIGRFGVQDLSLWGGLVGAGLTIAFRLRRHPFRAHVLDAAATGLALGIVVGRIGAFVDGHGQGLPTSLAWATLYTHPLASTPDFGVWRHPAQAYDGLVALALLLLITRVRASWAPGVRAKTFLAGYAAARVALGAVRLDPPFLFGLQLDQLLAIATLAYMALSIGWRWMGRLLHRSGQGALPA